MLRSVLQSGCAPRHISDHWASEFVGNRLPSESPFDRRLGLAVPVAVRPFHAKQLVPRALRRAADRGLSLSGGAFVAHRGQDLHARRVVRYPRRLLCAASCQPHSLSLRFFLPPFVPPLLSFPLIFGHRVMKACGIGADDDSSYVAGLQAPPPSTAVVRLAAAHTATAAAVGLCGIALIAVGTWAVVTQSGSQYNRLTFESSVTAASLYLSMSTICVGVLLVLLPPVGLVAARRGSCRAAMTAGYVVCLCLLTALLLFTAVVMLQVSGAGTGRPATRTFFLNAWRRSVAKSPLVVCGVETEHQCRGFDGGECTGCAEADSGPSAPCDRTRCADCGAGGQTGGSGCYTVLFDELVVKARPVGITAAATSVAVLADLVLFVLTRVAAG